MVVGSEMSAEQAERLVAALEAIAKATQASAVMQEEQFGLLNDIHRRLAEIDEAIEAKGGKRGGRKS